MRVCVCVSGPGSDFVVRVQLEFGACVCVCVCVYHLVCGVFNRGLHERDEKMLFWELEEFCSSSGASVVAIDNKIEQAMDLVKSHLMYAVREEVEVLKEQIKELMERNSQLEQENALLKNLSSPEQLLQFQTQTQTQSGSPTSGAPPTLPTAPGPGPTA
ncbi:uncharacterized protein isoform X2 [Danio rerio]|uniref:Uncharacterized protein isoform X2 n=1 Tax=Danio rerio TaxID=7955 RepID=A0AC58JQT0_DANRE